MKVRLGDLTRIRTGKLDANASSPNGAYPFFTCSKEPLRIDSYSYDCECVLVAGNGDLNVKYYNGKFDAYQRTYIIKENGENNLCMPYLYYFMDGYVEELRKLSIGGVIKYIKLGNLTDALIELPDIHRQKSIVNILAKTKGIIDHRRQELQYFDDLIKARFVEMFGDPISNAKDWNTAPLTDACTRIFGGGTPSKSHPEYFEGLIPWVSPKDMKSDVITDSIDHITEEAIENSTTNLVPDGSVLMVIRSGILKHSLPVAINAIPVTINQDMKAFVPGENVTASFLRNYFKAIEQDVLSGVRGVTADNIDFKSFQQRKIILPPIELQRDYEGFCRQVDKSKFVVQKALDETQLLFDSLMQQYFG